MWGNFVNAYDPLQRTTLTHRAGSAAGLTRKAPLEAARMDGASDFRIFATIVLPLSKAVIAVIGIFYAVGYWNSFFNAMIYLNDTAKWPIQNVLQHYVTQGNHIPGVVPPDRPAPPAYTLRMAIVVIATIPILLVYPFAQFVASDAMALGALDVLARAGRSVPDEVRVLSFDNSSLAEQASPRLTSLDNPLPELVRTAADMLTQMVERHTVPASQVLHSALVVRDSA